MAAKITLCDLFQTELFHVIVSETSNNVSLLQPTESEQHAWFVVFLEQHYCNVSVAGGKSIEQWLKYVLIYWPNCAGSNIEHWLKYVLIDWSNCGGSNIEQCQPWGNLEPLP